MKIELPNAYLTDKELTTKYRKLAAKADARIRRIEARIGQAKFKGIENYAYAAAKRMVSNHIGLSDGKPRFDRDISQLPRGQKEIMLGHVEQFIDYDTSTLRGYNRLWKNRTDTFNLNHETNISVDEYRQLWESEEFKQMVDEYGYRDAFDNTIYELLEGDVNLNDAIALANYKMRIDEFAKKYNKWYEQRKAAGLPTGTEFFNYEYNIKEIKKILEQGKKVPIMDITKITPDQIK